MTATMPLGRVVSTTFLALALTVLAGAPGRGDSAAVPAPDRDKQIADLEKQLIDLQKQLKSLKDGGSLKVLSASEEVLPVGWVNKFQWRCIGPAESGGRVIPSPLYRPDPPPP